MKKNNRHKDKVYNDENLEEGGSHFNVRNNDGYDITDFDSLIDSEKEKTKSSDFNHGSDNVNYDRTKENFDTLYKDHYRQLAFYEIIDADNPLDKINVLKEKLFDSLNEKIQNLKNILSLNTGKIKYKIDIASEYQNSIKKDLEDFKHEIENLTREKGETLKKLESIRKELYDNFTKLTDEKKNLIENRLNSRLDEINAEFSKLLENYQLLAEKKSEINKRISDENKESIAKRISRFESKKNQIQALFDVTHNKLKGLYKSGFTEPVLSFMNIVGYISLIAAGWFFSIFVVERGIQSQDYFSFLLGRIFTFGSEVFSQGNKFYNFVILLSGLLGIMLLITAFIWLIDFIIKYKSRWVLNLKTIDLEESEDNEILYWSPNLNSSILLPWLNLLPIIFIIGLIFILLSLFGTNPPSIENLMMSLSGQFIGAALTIAVTGLMIFYITKIIEPRFENTDNDKSTISFVKKNWELTISSSIFIIVIFSFIFIDFKNSTIALICYFLITLTTAFTLSYSLKYRGILNIWNNLDSNLKNLSLAIEEYSKKTTLDLKSLGEDSFRIKFEKCQEDFLRMIFIRNKLVEGLLLDKIRKSNRFIKWLNDFFGNRNVPNLDIRELSIIEEKYFPVYKLIIDDLKSDWNSTINDYKDIVKEIKENKKGESNFEKNKLAKINELENKIYNLKKVEIDYEKAYYNELKTLYIWKDKCEIDLMDGFDLGLWYRKNNYVLV